ncbi:MAG TPA: phosphodiester glycosidase family protein [Planctomycetota bacterium]|nr:phosphodiester glycosidase family protein [Planctomycetota bacterium]
MFRSPATIALVLTALTAAADGKAGEPKAGAVPWSAAKDSGWKELEPGLELREEELDWKRQEADQAALVNLRIAAVRLDAKLFALRVVMNPVKDGRNLADVAKAEKAVAASNGAYFGTKDEPVTLLVSGGKALTRLNKNLPRGGVFTLDEKGRAAVVPVADFKSPRDGLDFVVQNSPLLVAGGKVIFKDPQPARHRRTAIGVDADGRTVLAVCGSAVTLDEWAAVLTSRADGGLGLTSALNLDGGPSTGLAVEHEKAKVDVPAGRIIPQVLAILRREKPLPAER